MKELNVFRKFLSENITPDQTIFSVKYRDYREGLEVTLYVAADSNEEAETIADQYMDSAYKDSYKYYNSLELSEPFEDLDEKEQELFKGNIADFGIDTF
jgi:hypothetical protein